MKTLIKKSVAWTLVLAITGLLASCYPEQNVSNSDLDVVLTNYDSTYTFSSIHTYIMPDTIVPLVDPDNSNNNVTINTQNEAYILQQMATELHALGYTRLFDTLNEKPDVAILLNGIASTYYSYFYYDWYYYWGWYPYWPPYWDGGSYYYPWGVGVYNYTVGTLLVQMIDMKSYEANKDSLRVVWLGAINGLMQGTPAQARITNDINQMFKQSPYL